MEGRYGDKYIEIDTGVPLFLKFLKTIFVVIFPEILTLTNTKKDNEEKLRLLGASISERIANADAAAWGKWQKATQP